MLKPMVQIHDQEGILIAEFWDCWRLDPAPVQQLRTRYEEHLRKRGKPQVIIDLSGVGFAGSAALGNFVALHRVARQNDGRLVFCNVEPTVSEAFRASKLESLFEFVSDRTAALASIARGELPAGDHKSGPPGEPSEPRKPATGGLAGAGPLRRRKPESDAR